MVRVAINPTLLSWSRQRAGMAQQDLMAKFPRLAEWEEGETKPTLKQLEAFARAVYVPLGYLFLSEPLDESLPIPDFRTLAGEPVRHPSPNLLDAVYLCQQRQSWYRDYARISQEPEIDFIGSATLETDPAAVASAMTSTFGFDQAARRACPTWTDALRLFIRQAEKAGVLVMVSGVVRSNNYRRLDPSEFRGFALCDSHAPLIFINGADTKAAQMFTLAHELAHLWLGASAVSNVEAAPSYGLPSEEVWCNAAAAELLVPIDALRAELIRKESLADSLSRLARVFKVSTLVVLRRLLDANHIDRSRFDEAWASEVKRVQGLSQRTRDGGDFYRTTLSRVSRRFAEALVASTLEGQTLYRDAFRLLGVAKTETFNKLATEVGVLGR